MDFILKPTYRIPFKRMSDREKCSGWSLTAREENRTIRLWLRVATASLCFQISSSRAAAILIFYSELCVVTLEYTQINNEVVPWNHIYVPRSIVHDKFWNCMNAVDSDQFDTLRPSYRASVLLCLNNWKIASRDPRPRHIGLRTGFHDDGRINLSAEHK